MFKEIGPQVGDKTTQISMKEKAKHYRMDAANHPSFLQSFNFNIFSCLFLLFLAYLCIYNN